jgi:Helix-turn-helix domain
MIEHRKVSGRERQGRARQRAMSLQDFCETYSIGRTKAYEEINAGRLRARKAGRRTIITADDAEDWLSRLPALEEALDEAAS